MKFEIGIGVSNLPVTDGKLHLGKSEKKESKNLTFKQACEIRNLRSKGWSMNEIAKKFNKTVCCISQVCSYKTHKY